MVYEPDASIPNDEAGSICPCSDKIEAVNMQWRLRGSPPEEVLHASSRVLPAELAPVSAAVALDVVEDSFSQLMRSRWKHLSLQQQRSRQGSMQWRLGSSPPEEV